MKRWLHMEAEGKIDDLLFAMAVRIAPLSYAMCLYGR